MYTLFCLTDILSPLSFLHFSSFFFWFLWLDNFKWPVFEVTLRSLLDQIGCWSPLVKFSAHLLYCLAPESLILFYSFSLLIFSLCLYTVSVIFFSCVCSLIVLSASIRFFWTLCQVIDRCVSLRLVLGNYFAPLVWPSFPCFCLLLFFVVVLCIWKCT